MCGSGRLCRFVFLPVGGQSGERWKGTGAAGLRVREPQGMHSLSANAEVKGHQSGNSHQSLPHLPIVFPWKLTKPHCVLGLLVSVL